MRIKIDTSKYKSFPAAYTDSNLILDGGRTSLPGYHHSRIISKNGKQDNHRYFYIERQLLESTFYCAPAEQNLKSFSLQYESIIKECCSFFETLMKRTYSELHSEKEPRTYDLFKLNNNFLLSKRAVSLINFYDEKSSDLICSPYASLNSVLFSEDMGKENIPDWWDAYNSLKHDPNSSQSVATQENAFASLAAIFLLLHRIYGPGQVHGLLVDKYEVLMQREESKIFTPLNFDHWDTFEFTRHNWKDFPDVF